MEEREETLNAFFLLLYKAINTSIINQASKKKQDIEALVNIQNAIKQSKAKGEPTTVGQTVAFLIAAGEFGEDNTGSYASVLSQNGILNMPSLLALKFVLSATRVTHFTITRTSFDEHDWESIYTRDGAAPGVSISKQIESILVKYDKGKLNFENTCIALSLLIFASPTRPEVLLAKRTPGEHMRDVHDATWLTSNSGVIPKDHRGRMVRYGFSFLLFSLIDLKHLKCAYTGDETPWIVDGCNVLGCLPIRSRTRLFKCLKTLTDENSLNLMSTVFIN